MGKIILITGYVAGGKTTFSLNLAKRLNIPVFNKDTMKAEIPFILESNFKSSEAARLRQLTQSYDYRALSFVFVGDLHVLHRRFLARDNSPEREEANRIHGIFDDYAVFEKSIRPLGDFHVGDQIIEIDTTNFENVDFGHYIEEARRFMDSAGNK